jgi:hypothetical protein
MLSVINNYYDSKEIDEQTSRRMAIFAREIKVTNEYALFKKIITANINNTLDYVNGYPVTAEQSHALLHKIAGMRSVLTEIDLIITKDKLLDEPQEEEIENDLILTDSTDNALI